MRSVWIAAGLALAAPAQTQTIPETQLQVEENEQPVFPVAMRGTWAKSLADCKADDAVETFSITARRIYTYEGDSNLLIITPVNYADTPSGQDAYTIVALMAERGEGEVGTGKVRISRVGDKLHMSRATSVTEAQHFKSAYANVRCPEK